MCKFTIKEYNNKKHLTQYTKCDILQIYQK